MGEETANQGETTQSQQNPPQPVKNPLLNRPSNPQLDIIVRKGSDKPITETKQERQGGARITEQRKEEGKLIEE
jgi:hypothetical protein